MSPVSELMAGTQVNRFHVCSQIHKVYTCGCDKVLVAVYCRDIAFGLVYLQNLFDLTIDAQIRQSLVSSRFRFLFISVERTVLGL